ncbi:TPA: FTR1 family protein, partial [Enterococcus faecalis]
MKKIILCLLLLLSFTFNQQVFAESYENWTEVATEMNIYLDKAVKSYFSGDMVQAKEDINTAYFKFYEKLGFEKTVKTHISGRRVKNIEALFHLSKRLSVERGNEEELSDTIKELKINLLEDATKLDNSNGEKTSTQARKNINNSSVVFISSFGLTLREGLEAILVISAIIAYLVKTNNGELVKKVYVGTGLGVVFSVILAIIFTYTAQ